MPRLDMKLTFVERGSQYQHHGRQDKLGICRACPTTVSTDGTHELHEHNFTDARACAQSQTACVGTTLQSQLSSPEPAIDCASGRPSLRAATSRVDRWRSSGTPLARLPRQPLITALRCSRLRTTYPGVAHNLLMEIIMCPTAHADGLDKFRRYRATRRAHGMKLLRVSVPIRMRPAFARKRIGKRCC